MASSVSRPRASAPSHPNQLRSYELSDDQREIAERIRGRLQCGSGRDYDHVVQMALSRLSSGLRSEREDVLEDVRREIAFRDWCESMISGHTDQPNHSWKIRP